MAKCKTCDAEIEWVITTTGSSMPVDADPVPDGNITLADPPPLGRSRTATVYKQTPMLEPGPYYVSHFVTCPDADQHRRTRAR